MRKAAALAVLLALAGAVWAQGTKDLPKPDPPRDKETGKVTFQEGVQVEGATAKELRLRAKGWADATFKSSKEVVQADDEAKLVLRPLYLATGHGVWMTISIEFKESRYQFTLTDIVYRTSSSSGGQTRFTSKDKNIEQLLLLIEGNENGRAATQARIKMVTEWLAAADSYISSLKKALAGPAKGA